jgi:hypothetical protein
MATRTLSNEQFIEKHASEGCVGLAGGTAFVDRAIRRAQSALSGKPLDSAWSHAFLFSGRRVDGHHWVLESDIEIHRRHVRLGVQENRAQKYFDADEYPNLAILDFGLAPDAVRKVLTEALELLAGRSHYSLREIVGTMLALKQAKLRTRDNLLAREGALYCSAFVSQCYARAGIELAADLATKNTTPQDLAETRVPHRAHRLVRCTTVK